MPLFLISGFDVGLSVVGEGGMSGRNVQRKLGTTRGSPRRSRTAKASRIRTGSALPTLPQSVPRGRSISWLHWFASATACQVACPPVRIRLGYFPSRERHGGYDGPGQYNPDPSEGLWGGGVVVRSSHGHFVKTSGLRWLTAMAMVPVPWNSAALGLALPDHSGALRTLQHRARAPSQKAYGLGSPSHSPGSAMVAKA